MLQSPERPGPLFTVMFSPAEPNVVAVAGLNDGAVLYDIRNLKKFVNIFFKLRFQLNSHLTSFSSRLYSLPSEKGTCSARFNGSGTRLLFSGDDPQLAVFDIPTRQQPTGTGKVLLDAPDFYNGDVGYEACCFAGVDDEMVICASDDHILYVWGLSESKGQDCTIDRPLRVLKGHEGNVNCVRFNGDKSAIISCDVYGVIKLWSPDY